MEFEKLKPARKLTKRKKRSNATWSEAECVILANHYYRTDMLDLRKMLRGRSAASISTKVTRLKASGWAFKGTSRPASGPGSLWTPVDELYLLANEHKGITDLAIILKRSEGAISARLKKLKENK